MEDLSLLFCNEDSQLFGHLVASHFLRNFFDAFSPRILLKYHEQNAVNLVPNLQSDMSKKTFLFYKLYVQ